MHNCKDLCSKIPNPGKSKQSPTTWYGGDIMRCMICEKFFALITGGNVRCPCCGSRCRTKPHHKRWKGKTVSSYVDIHRF